LGSPENPSKPKFKGLAQDHGQSRFGFRKLPSKANLLTRLLFASSKRVFAAEQSQTGLAEKPSKPKFKGLAQDNGQSRFGFW
jgi:hypothetical protein